MSSRKQSTYQSYLLRLWRDNPEALWQASLQSTATEQVYHFAELDQLWAFLTAQVGADVDNREAGDAPPPASRGLEK